MGTQCATGFRSTRGHGVMIKPSRWYHSGIGKLSNSIRYPVAIRYTRPGITKGAELVRSRIAGAIFLGRRHSGTPRVVPHEAQGSARRIMPMLCRRVNVALSGEFRIPAFGRGRAGGAVGPLPIVRPNRVCLRGLSAASRRRSTDKQQVNANRFWGFHCSNAVFAGDRVSISHRFPAILWAVCDFSTFRPSARSCL